jgi:hypothetical protein
MFGHRSALRDVIARFAVHVDDTPLTKLDKQINVLSGRLKTFAGYATAAFAAATVGAYHLVEAASKVEENLNVIRVTFGESGEQHIKGWSEGIAKELSRSEFMIQDSVAKFGAFLKPMFAGTTVDIREMSKMLAELGVDLASFYNTSDEEAQMRLFSGMAGETEAVRRLGIDISDKALQQLDKSKGRNRPYKNMTAAEKNALRFEKIIIDTKDAQGDAARTAGGWANSLKRVQGQMHRMAVIMGKRLMPIALKMLEAFEGFLQTAEKWFNNILVKSSALETAMLFIKVTATAAAVQFGILAIQSQRFLVTMMHYAALAGPMLQIAAAFLAVEDVFTFFQDRDNESFIGTFLQAISGLERPLDVVDLLFERLSAHAYNIYEYFAAAFRSAKALFTRDFDNLAYKPETIDIEAIQTKRIVESQQNFVGAVQDGRLEEAARNHYLPGESEQTAYRRALKMREDYVRKNPGKANAQDVASGWALGYKAEAKDETGKVVGHTTVMDTQTVKGAAPPTKRKGGPSSVTFNYDIQVNAKDAAGVATTLAPLRKSMEEHSEKTLRRAKGALGEAAPPTE